MAQAAYRYAENGLFVHQREKKPLVLKRLEPTSIGECQGGEAEGVDAARNTLIKEGIRGMGLGVY